MLRRYSQEIGGEFNPKENRQKERVAATIGDSPITLSGELRIEAHSFFSTRLLLTLPPFGVVEREVRN